MKKKKNGKEVPVNVQISDYLKSMHLLENSCESLEKTIEKIFRWILQMYWYQVIR